MNAPRPQFENESAAGAVQQLAANAARLEQLSALLEAQVRQNIAALVRARLTRIIQQVRERS